MSLTPFTVHVGAVALVFFSSHDLHVHTIQFCNAVSAVISTHNFLYTSAGATTLLLSPCVTLWVFPVCADDQVTSIHDLAFSLHKDNTSAITYSKKA